ETGGILDQLLPDLLNFLETAEDTRKQVISALTYPFVLLVTGILSVALLLIYVVPQFTAMFEDVGSEIPASAQFLLGMSVGMKRRKDAFLLGMPVVGRLLIHQDVAIFSRTLGALLGAGIPLIRGLRVAREVISNEELIYHLEVVEEDVRSGAGLGVSLEKTGLFPVLL
ncbi:MAG: type II secretion system F family protein, partial [Pseudomonadales bacterium]